MKYHFNFLTILFSCVFLSNCAGFNHKIDTTTEDDHSSTSEINLSNTKDKDIDGVTFYDEDSVPPLHKACNSSHIDINLIKELMAKGENINEVYRINSRFYKEDQELTPLGIACYRSDIDVDAIRVLIRLGADINKPNTFRTSSGYKTRTMTPLIGACDRSEIDDEAIKTLLEFGADINATTDDGASAIMVAADRHDFDANVIEMLMDAGANLTLTAKNDGSALLTTLVYDERLTAKAIAMGAITDYSDEVGCNAFDYAAAWGSSNTVKLFLNRGEDIHHRDFDGDTPINNAAYNNTLDVVKTLYKAGGSLSDKTNNGRTLLMSACNRKWKLSAVKTPQFDLVEFLVKKGANIKDEDERGWTALEYAALSNTDTSEIIKYLIKKGADVNHQTKNGYTPFMFASHPNNIEILKQKKSNINQTSYNGNNALHRALIDKDFQVVPKLIQVGVDINHPNHINYERCLKINDSGDRMVLATCSENSDGFSPIYYAWNPDVIRYMASHGAIMNPDYNVVGPISFFWNETDRQTFFYDKKKDAAWELSPEEKANILLAYLRAGAKPDLLSPTPEQIKKAIQENELRFKSNADKEEFFRLYQNDNFIISDKIIPKLMELTLSKGIYKGIIIDKETKFDQLIELGTIPDNAVALYMKYTGYPETNLMQKIIQKGGKKILNRSDEFNIEETSSDEMPVLIAILFKAPKFLKDALDAGADPNVIYKGTYRTKVNRPEVPCHGPSPMCYPFIDLHIKGMTPLMLATQKPDQMQILIEAGADVNIKTEDNLTALILAVLQQKTESVKLLIKAGADVNFISDDFGSPLHIAQVYNNKDIIKILKNNGAKDHP